MEIFCISEFKDAYDRIRVKKAYSTLEKDLIAYFFNKTIQDLCSGTRLNNSDETPYIKKRLRGSGGYRVYFLALIKEENIYLMFIHPKTGPDGSENITDESKSGLYKKVLAGIQTNNLLRITLNKSQDSIIFGKP